MKKLLTVLFFVPFLCFGQDQKVPVVSNFYLENKEVQYRNTFQVDSLNSQKLYNHLKAFIPTVASVTNVQFSDNLITGEIKNLKIDIRKYGGSNFTSWIPVGQPMDGKFVIQIKDGKYRIILTDIYCKVVGMPATFTDYSTRKQKTEFYKARIFIEGIEYMNKDLTDRFTLTQTALKSDW